MEERLASVEERLNSVENDLQHLRANVHDIKNEQQVTTSKMESIDKTLTTITGQLSTVTNFIDGTDHVLGFCRKHWRTALKFGCGFVTAYGVTNPSVQRSIMFVQHFFGL